MEQKSDPKRRIYNVSAGYFPNEAGKESILFDAAKPEGVVTSSFERLKRIKSKEACPAEDEDGRVTVLDETFMPSLEKRKNIKKTKRYRNKSRIASRICFALAILLLFFEAQEGLMVANGHCPVAMSFGVPAITLLVVSLFGPFTKEEEEQQRRQLSLGIRIFNSWLLCCGNVFLTLYSMLIYETKQASDQNERLFLLIMGILMITLNILIKKGIIKLKQKKAKNTYSFPSAEFFPSDISLSRNSIRALSGQHRDVSDVDFMDGHEFEHFCANLLRKNGFVNVIVTQGSGDQGVDVIASKNGIKYAVQCKNYNVSSLSNKPIQEVYAGKAYYNCHVGVVLTNSTFTPGAVKLAEATGVLLWDRDVLQQMMNAVSD